jgi:hypothetical protein
LRKSSARAFKVPRRSQGREKEGKTNFDFIKIISMRFKNCVQFCTKAEYADLFGEKRRNVACNDARSFAVVNSAGKP